MFCCKQLFQRAISLYQSLPGRIRLAVFTFLGFTWQINSTLDRLWGTVSILKTLFLNVKDRST